MKSFIFYFLRFLNTSKFILQIGLYCNYQINWYYKQTLSENNLKLFQNIPEQLVASDGKWTEFNREDSIANSDIAVLINI